MKDTIRSAFDKWTERLGLRWWTVNIYWHEGKEAKKYFAAGEDETILARVFSDWRYADANIHINLPAWKGLSNEDVERKVVRELIHILVNEMREGKLHHEERVVTSLTKAVFWVDRFAKEDANAAQRV